jgi:DNA primase
MAKQVLGNYDLPDEGDIIDQVAHRHDRLSEMKKEVAELKARTDFKGLLTWFGLGVKKNGKGWKILCPFHNDTVPSCSVDLEKGRFHCFGCHAKGDTIEFVKLYKHTDFKGAVEVLKEYNGFTGKQGKPVEKKKTLEVFFPEETELEKKNLLKKTIGEYHNQLLKNEKALTFLESRGLKDFELIKQHAIGFCDGKTLLSKLSGKQKELLKETGIINAKGREHFTGCIVFPVFTDAESAGEIYGRSITDKEPKHRYLPGKHAGIFNRKAGKVYDEIILTESFIDALSLIRLGINNVQAIYGTGGFTQEHLEALKDDRVKTIILGLDNDAAGRTASLTLQKRLVHEGFAVKTIFPPGVKDWNDFLVSKGDPDQVKKLIAEAPVVKQEEKKNTRKFSSVEKHLNTYTFTTGRMTYTVIGVKDLFVSSLRVAVRARCEDERFCDTVDLYSARSRKNYSAGLADEITGIEPARIQADLNKILDYLEEERNRRFNNRDKEERIELTDDEVKAGMKLLQNPKMVDEVLKDFVTLGYVGENENKLLVFFAALSRLLDDPLNIYIQAGSSSGKS